VHHETTTGRLNPVAALAEICEQHGVMLLLDAVSSFGAEAIPFHSPALAACAATANKCLHGIPGLCLVMVRRTELASAVEPPRSMTLDLALWSREQGRRSTPFTPAVNGFLALDQALVELAGSGGWTARHARYHELANQVAERLARNGVTTLLPAAESSCALRAYRLPRGRSYGEVHDGMKQRGFVVYAGQGQLATEMFRISTMGDITDHDLERLLAALDEVFS
jgi:2-aminoethylphosphonate-pyruvate transaminase